MHIPFFRIFYSTTFSFLLLLLIVLVLVSPGDGIYQAYRNNQLWNVVVIAGVYLLILLVAVFVYATRVYTNKTHLASIPRAWIPIRKGDMPKSVSMMIVEGIKQSAIIAYNAHPRDLKQDDASVESERSKTPHWGNVSHPGWSAPSCVDLPSVHFEPVLLELPHLIEAKAVSLAPSDPLAGAASPDLESPSRQKDSSVSAPGHEAGILPDPLALEILQRPANLNLRAYLLHLTSLSMIDPPSLTPQFLNLYERARFSTTPLPESSFRQLMSTFATLLRSMTAPDPEVLAAYQQREYEDGEYGSLYYSSHSQSGGDSMHNPGSDSASLSTSGTVSHTPFHTPRPPQHRSFGGNASITSSSSASVSSVLRHITSEAPDNDDNNNINNTYVDNTNSNDNSDTYLRPQYNQSSTSPSVYRSASEGSLAGSEGTVRTAPSQSAAAAATARRSRVGAKARESSRSTLRNAAAARHQSQLLRRESSTLSSSASDSSSSASFSGGEERESPVVVAAAAATRRSRIRAQRSTSSAANGSGAPASSASRPVVGTTTRSRSDDANARGVVIENDNEDDEIEKGSESLESVNVLKKVETSSSSRSGAGSVIRVKEARSSLDLPYAFVRDGSGEG